MSYLIGITGGSGSGKTTFLKAITEGFSPEQVCILSQDHYYRPREEQKTDALGIHNFDLPESIDRPALVRDVQRLIDGGTVTKEEYVFNNDNVRPKLLTFLPAPVIILEGLFVFHYPEIAEKLDLKVYLHARENVSLIRRIRRDQLERNYPLDDVLYRFEHHVQPAFDRYIRPFAEEADIVVNNNKHFGNAAAVLRGFIANQL
jgi:uridine kinase